MINILRQERTEKLLWSIALPGFGQLLNRRYLKGVLFILLELTINHMARLNTIILLSFKGDITAAITAVDYQWLMFYPCVYMFAIWDAFKDAGGGRSPYATLLFVIPAYMATVGIMYSDTLKICNVLLGPVWLPMLFCFLGIALAAIIRKIIATLETSNLASK
ncbi:hypothetical protein [Ectobacillus funiculus]|uniref:Uncharacterized protein n=1 Tax=Ectobacillus funiculus TaxID=137993 RepID=A0ABV5WKN8_9BACI